MSSPEKAEKRLQGVSSPTGRKGKSKRPARPSMMEGSREAKRTAAMILEVLAGVRKPSDAASVLATSVPRYYMLEQQALRGLVVACEPRPRGPVRSPEREVERLRRQVRQLEGEVLRHQALVRASQRMVGLTSSQSLKPNAKKKSSDKKGRKRKPMVRALKHSLRLQSKETGAETETAVPVSAGVESGGELK